MSGFRPVIRFSTRRSQLAASLAAAGVAASAMIALAPGASAATAAATIKPGPDKVSTVKVGPPKTTAAKVSKAKVGKAKDTATVSKAKVSKAKGKGKGTANTAKAKPAKSAAVQRDYTFYDSINPSKIPANQQIATYADGKYAVERSLVSNPGQVIWIDINGHDANANALDVEPGNATPAEVASWVDRRLTAHPGTIAIVYTMRSDWAAAKASVATLPAAMRSQVRWWIADPTGHPHIVPGAQATQWYWGGKYDISTAEPGF